MLKMNEPMQKKKEKKNSKFNPQKSTQNNTSTSNSDLLIKLLSLLSIIFYNHILTAKVFKKVGNLWCYQSNG